MIELIKSIHCGAHAKVLVDGELSEAFNLDRGLKQGSVLAPMLFNIFFGAIMGAVIERTKDLGVKFRYKPGGDIFKLAELKKKRGVEQIRLMDLPFADDAVLTTD